MAEAAFQEELAAAPGQPGIAVRLLGPFAISSGGREAGPWPRPTARRLCQLVLVSPGRRVGREVACDALFPGLPPRAAARALSKALSMARAALAPLGEPGESLLSASLTHIWADAGATVDADGHRAALRAALEMAPGADRDDALVAALADEAELLDDEPYADWAIRARDQLDELRRQARLALARDRAASAMSAFPPPGAVAFAEGDAGSVPLAGHAPAAPAAREELRPVTMLFAEVDAPAGRMDPEDLREVVGSALAAVIAEVEGLGGRVTSVSGRGLQAMWGAPRANEDDPERALRAAYRSLAVPGIPALRIGIETGTAAVGAIGGGGRVEYGALGDVVAVAADLQARAKAGTALVGPATRTASGHLFSWSPQDPADTGEPACLGEPLAGAGQLRPRARGPLVGRTAELAVLDAALKRALAGHGSVVLLRGDPGLGKTRLVRECRDRFMAWVGARDGRLPLWLEGRAASYASATPYGLYQQLLAGWIGVAPDQPRAAVGAALERSLVRLLASDELLPLLEHVMGMPPVTGREESGLARPPQNEELREAAFGALRTVISRLVPARRPAVIVLEDLHWADPTSLRFTRELISLAATRPLLILATTRPQAGPDVDQLRRSPAVRTVELRPLPDSAARDLARALIGTEVSEEVVAAVLGSADGNPLFLEERLAALLETGALTRDDDGWGLREGSGHAVPQVLDRLIRSRIDRLGPVAQDVVRVAAVLGPEFPAVLLEAVCRRERAAAELQPALDELRGSGILQPVGSHHEEAYRFRHALLQDAAYYGLLRADRRRLHGHAAMALVASHHSADEVAAVVGRHFAAAGDGPQAIRYLEVAGDRATWAFANDEAIKAYEEGLAVSEELGDADSGARLQAKLANVLWRTARRDETRAAFTEALRLAKQLPEPGRLREAHLLTRLGRLEMADHRYDAAARALDAAAALLGDQPGETAAEADVWLELMIDGRAEYHLQRRDVDSELAILEAVRPVLEARGNATRRYGFYLQLACQRVVRDRLRGSEQAMADARRALAAAQESRDTKDIGYATNFLGWITCLAGDPARGRAHLLAAVEIAERVGETVLLASCLDSLLMVALAGHDLEVARELAPRAVEAARPLGRQQVTWVRAPLAWLAWQDGNADEVLRIAAELGPVEGAGPLTGIRREWVHLLPSAAVHLDRADVASAVAAARPVLGPAQQALPDELAGAIEAACRAWDAGRPGGAEIALSAGLDLARDLGFL